MYDKFMVPCVLARIETLRAPGIKYLGSVDPLIMVNYLRPCSQDLFSDFWYLHILKMIYNMSVLAWPFFQLTNKWLIRNTELTAMIVSNDTPWWPGTLTALTLIVLTTFPSRFKFDRYFSNHNKFVVEIWTSCDRCVAMVRVKNSPELVVWNFLTIC